jgi:hypothetical protein
MMSMQRIFFSLLGVVALGCSAALAAAPAVTPAQKAAICGKRTTCSIGKMQDAGKDASGAALVVAEVHFGVKDKSDDAPDDGCMTNPDDEKKDGGVEYWLLKGAKPVQILALCNDGYGAAGVGEDDVQISANRMTHKEDGGSNWRWSSTEVFSLSPFVQLRDTNCSYFNGTNNNGNVTQVDMQKFRGVTVAKNPAGNWGGDDTDNADCPAVTQKMFDSPQPKPAANLLTVFPVLTPRNGALDLANVPSGTALGTCAMPLSTDGSAGFVVFGKPAAADGAAQMRVVAPTTTSLLIQVYDPAPAKAPAGKSWISGSHVEVWTLKDDSFDPLTRAKMDQIAVDLDGTIHAGNKGAVVPAVQHWQARDDKGRPVTVLWLKWKDADATLGTAVSYSQAEAGKQARLVANTGMEHGVPLYVPSVSGTKTNCAIVAGVLNVK